MNPKITLFNISITINLKQTGNFILYKQNLFSHEHCKAKVCLTFY